VHIYTRAAKKSMQAKTESRIRPLIENRDAVCCGREDGVNSEEEMVWSVPRAIF
jgi:hypothetical protein